jgi:prepilin peptidase CpaA
MLATQANIDAALIAFVLSVAIIDLRTHRIPNLLCASAAVLGLISQVWLHGAAGLLAALGGAAVGFGMFLPFYMFRAFGAGDVKAMATVGIFLGLQATALAVGMTLIAGAAMGVAVLCLKPTYAGATMYRLIGLIAAPAAPDSTPRRRREDSPPQSSLRFPYGVAIATGTAAALFATGRFNF